MDSSTAAVAAMLGVAAVVSVASLVLYVLTVIAEWKMFTKAGEPGWKAIIPLYNSYILYKISWKTSMFWIVLALSFVSCILISLASTAAVIIGYIIYIAAFVLSIMAMHRVSKSFGHGAGFTVGLIFLSPIFLLILGFGSSQYKKLD